MSVVGVPAVLQEASKIVILEYVAQNRSAKKIFSQIFFTNIFHSSADDQHCKWP
jgi:hypothetical protein